MDNDDVYHDLDKADKASHVNKFDSDESDKDEKEKARMKKKLLNKQKKESNKDDVDINQFIGARPEATWTDENEKDDTKAEKKPKVSKKEKRKQKKQNARDHINDEENKEEEKKVEAQKKKESKAEDEKHPDWPKEVHYCPACTVPAEYCALVSRDLDDCKDILKKDNPSLYGVIYEGREEELVEESKGKKKKNKNLTTKKEITKDTEIKVTKFKRGGKKMVTQISGLDSFGINLKDFSKKLGKKFACGNAIVKDEVTDEQVVQLLGEIDEDDLMEIIEKDYPDLAVAKFKFESGGNKKGRKKKDKNVAEKEE